MSDFLESVMRMRRYELDSRVLTVFFFVAIPFVAFGAYVVINMARQDLQTSMGTTLEQRAQQAQDLVERYVLGQYIHLHLLSLDPQVRQAVSSPPSPATPQEARRLDQAWGSGEASLKASIVESSLATRLRELGQVHPGLKLLQVVDAEGRLVASTARAGRLWNAETAWFRSLGAGPAGDRAYFVDIQNAPGSQVALLELAYPIRDTTEGRTLGVVRALFDTADLVSTLAPVRLGNTGHAVLIRAQDGMILASDERARALRDRYPGFSMIQAAQRERRGSWAIPEIKAQEGVVAAPQRVVGFSRLALVPDVDWMVAVEQDLGEAMAPVQGLTRYLFLHFVAVFGTAFLLALYFSFKLETPVIADELHMHEEHLPAGYRPSPV